MYAEAMSDKISWPSRMSLPLSEEERKKIIALKADLQIEKRTLKDFVMDAIWEKLKREKGQKK